MNIFDWGDISKAEILKIAERLVDMKGGKLPGMNEAIAASAKWRVSAHDYQIFPKGDWTTWLMLAGRGAGKALALDTPIPTPSGWTTMGALRDGDTVFDETGKPCRVVQAHPVLHGRECFKVTFSDGAEVIADAEHLWKTQTRRKRKSLGRINGRGDPRKPQCLPIAYREIFTTAEIAASLYDGKEVNHAVRVAGALQLPEKELPIDPYVLGAWLGDGSSATGEITTCDFGVLDEIEAAGETVGSARETGNASFTYSISPHAPTVRKGVQGFIRDPRSLTGRLQQLGVRWNKHIPDAYLRASQDQRAALLQGLMDTDGYVSERGIAEFCSTNKVLADGVMELVLSLGIKATFKTGRATINGRDCGPKYRVMFTPYQRVFRLERKAMRVNLGGGAQAERQRRRYIVAVEPVPSVPVRCITVDSPSRLYLCSRWMIPTHNTRTAAENLRDLAYFNPGSRLLVSAPTWNDIDKTCFNGESGLLAVIPPQLISKVNQSDFTIELINGSLIESISAEKPERFRGRQFHGGWCDELAAWQYAEEAWSLMMMCMRLGTHPRIIATTTPKPRELIKQLVKDPHTVITRASTYDNMGNLAPTMQRELLKWEGTKYGRQEIYGELLDPEDGGIIKREWWRLWPASQPIPRFEFIVVSLDTAFTEKTLDKKTGDPDPTACSVWGLFSDGGRWGIMLLDAWEDWLGLPELIEKVRKEANVRYGDDERRPVYAKPGTPKPLDLGRSPDLIIVEDKGSGISLRQMLAREGLMLWAYNPGKADKTLRLHQVSHMFAKGYIYVPESKKVPGHPATWAEGLISQVCTFAGPGSTKHDDYVDTTSQALRYFADNARMHITREVPVEHERDYSHKVENPYAA